MALIINFSLKSPHVKTSCGICLRVVDQKKTMPNPAMSEQEKDFSQEWLSLFSFREICPDLFGKDISKSQEVPAWQRLPIDFSVKKETPIQPLKYWPVAQWDGRDFRSNEKEES